MEAIHFSAEMTICTFLLLVLLLPTFSSLLSFQFNFFPTCSYTRIDPAQEIARLRHSINQLEAYVFPSRIAQPQRRPSEASINMIPKKEPMDLDMTEKSPMAPGMLDRQGQGGLYSGPTSAALHLLSVCCSLFFDL